MAANSLSERMAHLEGAFEQIGLHLANIDARFAAVDARVTSLENRLAGFESRVETRFDAMDRKIDQRFMWTIGVVVAAWFTTIAAIFFR